MLEINKIHHGNCLELMQKITEKSIDMILCDLPYGYTACQWDSIIPLDKLWIQYERIIKDNGAIVLTSSQPFTSMLVTSNPKLFRYELIWLKTRPSNVFNANKMFMKWHENVLIFYKKLPTYNPQMRNGHSYKKVHYLQQREKGIYGKTGEKDKHISKNNGLLHPKTVIEISNPNHKSLHPTQKPLELFEYLIKTYSNKDDLILDNCIGSGTTAEACLKTNRKFIGIELEEKYVAISNTRIKKYLTQTKLATPIPPTAKAAGILGGIL